MINESLLALEGSPCDDIPGYILTLWVIVGIVGAAPPPKAILGVQCTHSPSLMVMTYSFYHKIMVIYPYHFLVSINQLFSCIIFIIYFICI